MLNSLESNSAVWLRIYLRKCGCRTLTICDFAVSDLYSEPIWEAVKFLESMPQPPKCFYTLRRSLYKRSVPMLCPSIDGVLATPLSELSMGMRLQPFFHPLTMPLSSLSIIFTVYTQTQRHTSRWWSCQKHLKECRY